MAVKSERISLAWGGPDHETVQAVRRSARRYPKQIPLAALGDDQPAPWTVTVEWSFPKSGTAVPVAIELRSSTGAPVNAEVWRSVRVRDVLSWTRFRLRETGRVLLPALRSAAAKSVRGKVRALSEPDPGKPGRSATYDNAHFERVAALHRQALATSSKTPLRDVAEALESTGLDDYRGVTSEGDSRVKGWVAACRRRGLMEGKADHGVR